MSETDRGRTDEQLTVIVERIGALEKENRRLRSIVLVVPAVTLLASIGIATLTALGIGVGARLWPRDAVRAHKISLIDQDRHVRAHLSTDNKGITGLSITDSSGKARLTFGVGKSGSPYLAMRGEDGRTTAYMGISRGNRPGFVLRDGNHVLRAALTLGTGQAPMLWLSDRAGTARARLTLSGEKQPRLQLDGSRGKSGVTAIATLDGLGLSVRKYDPKNERDLPHVRRGTGQSR